MAITVDLQYGMTFGKGDSSDWFDWEATLNEAEEAAYLRDKKLRLSLNDDPALEGVLHEAYTDIEDEEISNGISYDDEYTRELQGCEEVDPDEINDLVAARDAHTLEFFGLTDLSDEELDAWDANELDDLPYIRDFDEDFEPESPFDNGWSLHVEFAEAPDEEDLEEEEARATLTELLKEAAGNYEAVNDYVDRCEDLYVGSGTLQKKAAEIAASLGLTDFPDAD